MLTDFLGLLTVSNASASLCACVLVYFVVEWVWFRMRYDWHKIPGPPIWPIVGDMPSLIEFGKGDAKIHEYVYHWWRKLGRPKVFRRMFFGRRVLIVADPSLVLEITGHHGLPKSPLYKMFSKVFSPVGAGNILLRRANDEKWKAMRKHVARAFSTENLKKTFPKVLATAHQLIDELAKVPAGEAIDIRKMLTYATFEVVSSWGMGVETNAIQNRSSPLLDSILNAAEDVLRDSIHPSRKIVKKWFPFTETAKKSHQLYKCLHTAMHELYARMKRNASPAEDGYSIASCILDARNSLENHPFTEEELKSEAIVFFFAGTDTTSQQLAWALCCLACNEDVQSKLAQEVIDAGFVGSNAKDLTYDDLRRLPYANAVIKETMRLLPAVGTVSARYLEEDATICGYRIPKHTIVGGQAFTMNRLDSVFENPDTFDPDRWLGNELPHNQHDPKTGTRTLWTFSNGPRDCVGQRLAIMEMQVILPLLVGRFNVELDEQMGGWEGAMARKMDRIVSMCKGGMWVKLSPRN